MKRTLDSTTALRELRALVGTYLEGSDDAARATELLDALEPQSAAAAPATREPARGSVDAPFRTIEGVHRAAVQEGREREMFGCTAAAIDEVLDGKEPRDVAMYAMGTLSNAQELIQRDGDEPFAWSVRRADANTIRQLMNIAKHAINKAVPR